MDARAGRSVVALVILSVALAGCGGGGGLDVATPTTRAVSDRPPADQPATLEDQQLALDATVYYGGFRLTFDMVEVTRGVVTVSGTAENLSSSSSRPPTKATLAVGSVSEPVSLGDSHFDQVPGQSSGPVAYGFRPDPSVDLAAAVLQVGGTGYAQAEVPLGGRGRLVANEPVELTVSGDLVAGDSTFRVSGGEVRFDVPEVHDAAEAGSAFLTLRFDVQNADTFAGGYAFADQDIRLQSPSGSTLAPDQFPIELLEPSSTTTDLMARWTIHDDEPGTYAFVGLRDVGQADEAQGQLTFEVPALG